MEIKNQLKKIIMKQFLILLLAGFFTIQGFSQPLFTYGPNQVNKDEFLRAYNKNKTPVTDKEQSLREYLDLYIKFKLKVKEAKVLKLDTLQQMQYDIQNFRGQLEEGYLNDEKSVTTLLDEVFERSQKDIHLLHFSVLFNTKMNAEDSIKAYKAINEAREELLKGKTNYDELVDDIKEKITPIKGTDMGYITAFSLPYNIETLVYNLKPGEVTKVYRTKSALHIFKNTEERQGAGKWKVAQVLLAIPPNVSGPALKEIEKRADSIYELLQQGADFAELAKKYSDDRLTYQNGGELQQFGTGKYELPFEKAVFALKKDGDYTKPIFTGYGFHIVKRLQQHPIPTDKMDETYMAELKELLIKDKRINIAKDIFTKDIMAKTGFKRNAVVKAQQLFRYADSVAANGKIKNYPINKLMIFSFTKSNVTGRDWLNFIKDYKLNTDVYKGETNEALLDKYISTATIEYYRKHLEEFNEDFKYQQDEFKEGNMLFEIMERKIWSKASNDSIGLKKYYNENKAKYQWAESADTYLFNCNTAKTADEATAALHAGKNWKQIAEESDGKIQVDSGRYELTQLQVPAGAVLNENTITTPLLNAGDNTSSFVKIIKLYPASQQRSFDEARGLVINDYQNFLEAQWIETLKKKYPVKVNEPVFQSLLK
jgi:peptidyl-prolyl cis-trans isomerase SurA